jgi:hypothetical protein
MRQNSLKRKPTEVFSFALLCLCKHETQCTIWLIDFGLKRNTQSHGSGEGSTGVYGRKRMTFHGKDRRFVEVDRLSQDEYVSTKGRSALDFLAVLDEMFTSGGYQPGHVLQHYQGYHCWFICETCDGAGSVLAPPPKRIDRDVRVLRARGTNEKFCSLNEILSSPIRLYLGLVVLYTQP